MVGPNGQRLRATARIQVLKLRPERGSVVRQSGDPKEEDKTLLCRRARGKTNNSGYTVSRHQI